MWKTPRTLLLTGAALVVGLGVGAAVVPALAAQDPVLTPDQQSQLSQQVQAYRACLEQQGVTLPDKPADGSRPQLSDEQRAALEAAHAACEAQEPQRPQLSDEQKAQLQTQVQQHRECMQTQLSNAGITLPERPAPGTDGAANGSASATPPPRPQITDEQKAAIDSARQACASLAPNLGVDGIGPMGGHGPGGPGGPGRFGGPGGPRGQAGSGGSGSGGSV